MFIPRHLVFFASPARLREDADQSQATQEGADDFTDAEKIERGEMETRLTGELQDLPEGSAWEAAELRRLTWNRETSVHDLEDTLTSIRTFKLQMAAFERQLAAAIASQPAATRWTYDAKFKAYAWAKERTWTERQQMLVDAGSAAEIGWEAIAASESAGVVEKNLKHFPEATQKKFTTLKKTFDGRQQLPKEASDKAVRAFAEFVTKRSADLPGLKSTAAEHARFAANKELPLIAEGVTFTIKNREGVEKTWTGWVGVENFHTLSLGKRREWLGKLKDAIKQASAETAALQKMKAAALKKKPTFPDKWTAWLTEVETYERAARAAGTSPGEQTLGRALEYLEDRRAELQPTLAGFARLDARGGQYATPEAARLVTAELQGQGIRTLPRADFEALTPKYREEYLEQLAAAYDAVDAALAAQADEVARAEAQAIQEQQTAEKEAADLEQQAEAAAAEAVRAGLVGLDLGATISKEAARRTEASKAFTQLAGARDAARQGGALANIKKWVGGGEAASAANDNAEQADRGAEAELADVTDDARLTEADELRRDVASDTLKNDAKLYKKVRQLLGIGDSDEVDAATEQRMAYLVATANDPKKFRALLQADNDTKKLFDHQRALALRQLQNTPKEVKNTTPEWLAEAA